VRRALEAGSGKRAGADFGLGMNPEFLTEGQAVADFMNPDRLVLGGIDARTHALLEALYQGFEGAPRILTNPRTAEMIKYASNALLATAISFSNEIARLCARVGGVDVADVMRGVHESAYLTARSAGAPPATAAIASFLQAGCGFGGSCLPKDVAALIGQGAELGVDLPLLRSVLEVNRRQPAEVMRLIAKHYPSLRDVPVTVLGLAFKPETDDTRESPAFPIITRLREAGARVTAFDPVARLVDHPALDGVRLAGSLSEAVTGAAVVVLVTRWREFGELRRTLSAQGQEPLIVDGRRMLVPAEYERYEGIGR
jgi:UDPglucose 6-dehydrogenase/GDP-mannose 6-dehydrogenase